MTTLSRICHPKICDAFSASRFSLGVIEVELRGKKVNGGFALVLMQGKNWLLIKMKDAHADSRKNLFKSCPESVKSGKTIKQVRAEHKRRDDTI